MPDLVPVRSKLPAAGTTIFTVMSALAQKHGAVNLGQGFPDYPIDPALIDLVTDAMRAGHNQYPLMPGVLALREAIAAQGARACTARLRPGARDHGDDRRHAGDLHDDPGARASGRRGHRLRAGVRQLRAGRAARRRDAGDARAHRSRITGSTGTRSAARSRRGRASSCSTRRTIPAPASSPRRTSPNWPRSSARTPIVVISDEVYEHMVYDGARHESIARHDGTCRAQRRDRLVRQDVSRDRAGRSATRSRPPRSPPRSVGSTSSPCSRSTAPSSTGLRRSSRIPTALRNAAAVLRAQARPLCGRARGRSARPAALRRQLLPAGALRRVSDEPAPRSRSGSSPSTAWRSIPLSAFYRDGTDHRVIRFCFAKREETLREAAQRLARLSDAVGARGGRADMLRSGKSTDPSGCPRDDGPPCARSWVPKLPCAG